MYRIYDFPGFQMWDWKLVLYCVGFRYPAYKVDVHAFSEMLNLEWTESPTVNVFRGTNRQHLKIIKKNQQRKLSTVFRGINRICFKLIKKNRKMSTCNRLDLELRGSWPIMIQNSSRTLGHQLSNSFHIYLPISKNQSQATCWRMHYTRMSPILIVLFNTSREPRYQCHQH